MRIWISGLFCVVAGVASADVGWREFSQGWGYALAVEDHCPDMWVVTDAVMGSHLNADDYARAQGDVHRHRLNFSEQLQGISCGEARRITSDLLGLAVEEAWEPVR